MPSGLFSLFKKRHRQTQDDMALNTSTRPSPNPKTYGGRASTSSDPNHVVDAFGRLSIGNGRRSDDPRTGNGRRPQDGHGQGQGRRPSGQFVGGFNQNQTPYFPDPHAMQVDGPSYANNRTANSAPAFPIPALPTPPAHSMPVPQTSLTMQYAMTGSDAPLGALPLPPSPPPPRKDTGHGLKPPASGNRPHSDSGTYPANNNLQVPPSTPLRRPPLQAAPNSAPAKPGSSRPIATPLQTPSRRRQASSSPPSPSVASSSGGSTSGGGKGGLKVQCSGTTKLDKRCTRMVQVSVPLARLNADRDIAHYCHQHLKGAFEDKKFWSHKKPSVEVFYAEWVPEYLQDDTQDSLREQMRLVPSAADEYGFIYAFEIDDPTDPDVFHIKVGRAVKLTKRLHEWDKQCQSKQTHLRGFWPSTPDADKGNLARGRVKVGDPGPYCHRLERLIHLELADLAVNALYLDKDYPNVKGGNGSGNGNGRAVVRKACPDCGAVHKEIFSFPRAKKGHYKGKEWEEIVKPVIEKWGLFVETYYEPLPVP